MLRPALRQAIRAPIGAASSAVNPAIVWQSGMESGDTTDWTEHQFGEAVFDAGVAATTISDERAHTGTYAIRQEIDTTTAGDHAARIFRWRDADGNPLPTHGFYSAWLYLPQYHDDVGGFWNLVQFKDHDGETADPIWTLNIESAGEGRLQFYWFHHGSYSGESNFSVENDIDDLPLAEWVHIETEYLVSESAGVVRTWINGEVWLEATDVRTIESTDHELHWSINNYSNGLDPASSVLYWDDAVIATERIGP